MGKMYKRTEFFQCSPNTITYLCDRHYATSSESYPAEGSIMFDEVEGAHCDHCYSERRQAAYTARRLEFTVTDISSGEVLLVTLDPKQVPWREKGHTKTVSERIL